MSRIRLLRTASFRLAVLYLALFTASALALGAFVYMSVQREIPADFDERIVEETGALVLSEFTGAADELGAAFLINPHDIEGLKEAIVRAARVTPREARRRMRSMRRRVWSAVMAVASAGPT